MSQDLVVGLTLQTIGLLIAGQLLYKSKSNDGKVLLAFAVVMICLLLTSIVQVVFITQQIISTLTQ